MKAGSAMYQMNAVQVGLGSFRPGSSWPGSTQPGPI